MQHSKQVGTMRLAKEAQNCHKEMQAQMKKNNGRLEDNFICLPDPSNTHEWYYIAFGLDMKGYRGGYFMGKIELPDEYPFKPPKITLITKNGRFHTQKDGICLSISHHHPESWNPMWRVNQIVIGLISYWLSGEGTYGSIRPNELNKGTMNTWDDFVQKLTIESRAAVKAHPKYFIFEEYASAIGIDEEMPMIPDW